MAEPRSQSCTLVQRARVSYTSARPRNPPSMTSGPVLALPRCKRAHVEGEFMSPITSLIDTIAHPRANRGHNWPAAVSSASLLDNFGLAVIAARSVITCATVRGDRPRARTGINFLTQTTQFAVAAGRTAAVDVCPHDTPRRSAKKEDRCRAARDPQLAPTKSGVTPGSLSDREVWP